MYVNCVSGLVRLAVLLTFVCCAYTWAQEDKDDGILWLEGTAILSLQNMTQNEAKQRGLELALADALSRGQLEITEALARIKFGESSNDSTRSFQGFSRFIRSVTRGRVIESRIVWDTVRPLSDQSVSGSLIYCYEIKVRAKVKPEVGKPDPSFMLDLSLNQLSFRESDSMTISIISSKDCYLTIFNLYDNDSLAVIFPNNLMPDNRLFANEPIIIPPIGSGWKLRPKTLLGRDSNQEVLLAVATTCDVPFTPFSRQGSVTHLISKGEATSAVNQWLIDVSLAERTVSLVTYQVFK